VTSHITVRRMWDYVHSNLELSSKEQAHVSSCAACLRLFKLCSTAPNPEGVDLDDDEKQKSA